MTTSALELRNNLAIEILQTEDYQLLSKVNKYFEKVKAKLKLEQEETISKEELLAGIDSGIKEMKMGLGTSADDFLNELESRVIQRS